MAKNQKNQGFAAIRDVVSSSRFRESRLKEINDGLCNINYEEFNNKYNDRDVKAREKMRTLVNSDANKVTNVFSTLIGR